MSYNKIFEKQFECKTSNNLLFNRHLHITHHLNVYYIYIV